MRPLFIFSVITILALTFPVLMLAYYGLGPLSSSVGYSKAVFQSITLTLVSSALASLLLVAVLTPTAYYLARHESVILETISDIPASVPHPIIGIALILMNSRLTPIGAFLQSIGINFFNTLLGLVIALSIVSAPIYLKSIQPYFLSLPREPEIYAMGMGISESRTFLSVVLPNSVKSIVSACLISMSRAMSEFGSISIIAYQILQFPFYGVYPAPVLIYQYYSFYGLGPSLTSSALLVILGMALMGIVRLLGRYK